MECPFVVGQKVVCVDNDNWVGVWNNNEEPAIGQIYTIAKIRIDPEYRIPAVQLFELPRLHKWGYGAFRFRPLRECKTDTDISVFTQILDRANKYLEAV